MRAISFIIFMFLAQSLSAEDTFVSGWIVKRGKLSVADHRDILKAGFSSKGQPAVNTTLLTPQNTDYYYLYVSTKTDQENDFMLALESSGTAVKQVSFIIHTEPDFRTGESRTGMVNKIIYTRTPNDFNKSWLDFSVKRSTP